MNCKKYIQLDTILFFSACSSTFIFVYFIIAGQQETQRVGHTITRMQYTQYKVLFCAIQ